MMIKCNVCGTSTIREKLSSEKIKYKGYELIVPILYSVCSKCHREFVTKPQIILNEAYLRDAKVVQTIRRN